MALTYHLAQINIARMLAAIDDPIMAEFVANLDPINALAERSPGFVWRYQTPAGNATSLRIYDDELIIVNFSVWESVDALKEYIYKSAHTEFMRRRKQWFEKMPEMFMALWWIPAGAIPTPQEAARRLEHLRQHNETSYAFSFRKSFAPGDSTPSFVAPPTWNPCPAE